MTAVSPITKAARQAHIAEILAWSRVRSQEELAELLAQRGVRVAQATLSRDLEELGAVRLRVAGGALVYALPGDPGGPGAWPGGLSGGRVQDAHEAGGPAAARPPAEVPETADHVAGSPRGGGQPVQGSGPAGPAPGGRKVAGGSARAGGLVSALGRVAADLLVNAEASANLVVLRTPAGGAQLLASAIDRAGWPSILGTVAGDDTVLVITRDPGGGSEVAAALVRLAERKT